MFTLPQTPELIALAKRIVWFKEPESTLDNPIHFLACLMTYCTVEDLRIIKKYLTTKDFKYVLEHAPPGVFDPCSWQYWNVIC